MCDGTSSWREDIGQCGNRLILNGALYWPHGIVVVIKSWRDWNNQNVELIVRDLIGSLLCWRHLNTCDYLDNKIEEFVHIKNNRLQVDVDSGRLSGLLVSVDGGNTHCVRNRVGLVHTGLHRGTPIVLFFQVQGQ